MLSSVFTMYAHLSQRYHHQQINFQEMFLPCIDIFLNDLTEYSLSSNPQQIPVDRKGKREKNIMTPSRSHFFFLILKLDKYKIWGPSEIRRYTSIIIVFHTWSLLLPPLLWLYLGHKHFYERHKIKQKHMQLCKQWVIIHANKYGDNNYEQCWFM